MEVVINGMFLIMALAAALALLVCWFIIYSAVKAGTKKAIYETLEELDLIEDRDSNS